MTPTDLVKIKVHGATGTIILDREEKRNALSRAMIGQLVQAFEDLHQQRSVRAVILIGSGSSFCAGMDLQEIKNTGESDDPMTAWHEEAIAYRDLIETMLRFPKPIIAALNGPALAGGAGLALASDIVLASDEAQFGLPEARRGLVAGLVAPLLMFRTGGGMTSYLMLSTETLDAQEAYRRGIIHEITAPDKLWARANQIAGQCAQSAPEALQLTKRMINETIGEHLSSLLAAGAAVSATSRTTEAAQEGVAAFLEKRDPNWL